MNNLVIINECMNYTRTNVQGVTRKRFETTIAAAPGRSHGRNHGGIVVFLLEIPD